MDYKRIYEELIEHRKMLPKLEGVYYERHHIVPVCMGGGDEDENLIYLTAEDHFMAHLLLAKAHSHDGLWFAVQAMTMPTRSDREVKNRRIFGAIRREVAERLRNYVMDHTVYNFKEISTGRFFSCKRDELVKMYGWPRGAASKLVTGKATVTHGICLASTEDLRKEFDTTLYDFKDMATEKIYQRTRRAFCDEFNIKLTLVHGLVEGALKTCKGFCMATSGKDFLRNKRAVLHKFRKISTGEVYHKSVSEMVEEFGLQRTCLKEVVSGSILTTGGFCLDSTPPDTPGLNKLVRGGVFIIKDRATNQILSGSSKELASVCGFDSGSLPRAYRQGKKTLNNYEILGYEEKPATMAGNPLFRARPDSPSESLRAQEPIPLLPCPQLPEGHQLQQAA